MLHYSLVLACKPASINVKYYCKVDPFNMHCIKLMCYRLEKLIHSYDLRQRAATFIYTHHRKNVGNDFVNTIIMDQQNPPKPDVMPADNTTSQHYRCLVYNAMLRSKGGIIVKALTSDAIIGRTIRVKHRSNNWRQVGQIGKL